MTQNKDTGLGQYAPMLLKQAGLWFFIIIGFVHQFLMFRGITESIYVFVDPPGNIYPFVTLEWQWWWVLLLGSFIAFIAAFSDRIASVPSRFSVPFYGYLLFLLFLVRPINAQAQAELADLVITDFIITPANPSTLDNMVVTVVVHNRGSAPTESGFWTDLYVNPKTRPDNPGLGADHRWNHPSTGAVRGIGWLVREIEPGGSVTLTSDGSEGTIGPAIDQSNNNEITHWSGTLPVGSYLLYAYVDSYDATDPVHLEIVERDEENNLSEARNLIIGGEGGQDPASLVPLVNPPPPRSDLGQ